MTTGTQLPRAALYHGSTWHGRHHPVRRSFSYPTWSLLVDLDELPAVADRLRLLAIDRPGVFSLRREDLCLPLDADGARAWLTERGVDLPGGRIHLLTSPRVLGAAFNPLSLWWCHDADGRLAAVVAEVHNTYGERHPYLLRPDGAGVAATDKVFYVSPFLPVAGRYRARLRVDADAFRVHLGYELDGRRVLDATWRGQRSELSDRALRTLVLRAPFGGWRVAALIRWQGVRLWLRRLPIFQRDTSVPRDTPDSGDTPASGDTHPHPPASHSGRSPAEASRRDADLMAVPRRSS